MVPIQIYHSNGIVQNYGFFKREFQPMASAPDDSLFIIRPRHQLVFGIGGD